MLGSKNIVDVVLGMQYGDEAKGKVTHYLASNNNYTHVMRWGGGCNAGHTIIHNGQKLVTHLVPVGVLHGIKSIVGTGCVLNVDYFLKEIKYLENAGVQITGNLFVAENVHITTSAHLEEEANEVKVGTTRRGIGPTYRDKVARKGLLAKHVPELSKYLIDVYEEFHNTNENIRILCEGAQGFGLDVNWGDYPYVTSSQCALSGVFQNAISPHWIRDVWGVGKIYETYVGAKQFEPSEIIFQRIREIGEEYGATTGRARQCNWLNLNELIKAVKINSCNNLVINKMDVMRKVGHWKLYHDNKLLSFTKEQHIKSYILDNVKNVYIHFSEHKDRIAY